MTMKARYLTKSRFRLGLECPTKLYYTNNDEYHDNQESDPFMQALAKGDTSGMVILMQGLIGLSMKILLCL